MTNIDMVNPLFKIVNNLNLIDLCRVHNLTPMNCGSKMKLTENSDGDNLEYDDNTCLILSITMHNVNKWAKLNRDMFFHTIMDYIEKVKLAPEIMSSVISAIDEGMKLNSRLDTVLLYVWARADKKNIGLFNNGKLHYYFFNEFQHAMMTEENTIYFDFDNDHFIPLVKLDLLDDFDTMNWYEDILKFQDNIEKKLNNLNGEIAKQLMELDQEEDNHIQPVHDEKTDLEIAKALQEEEDKKTLALRQDQNMNNKFNLGQYEQYRRLRGQYRSNINQRKIPYSWKDEVYESEDKFADLKLCAKCDQVIHRINGLYWCDNCSKTITEVEEEKEIIDDNDYDGPRFKSCGICNNTIIEKNGLFECPKCEGIDEDKHIFDAAQYNMEKQLTNWDIRDDPYSKERCDNITFKPCRSCDRMIKETYGMFYCTYCNQYTGNAKPSNTNTDTYTELKREQEHLKTMKEHDIRERPSITEFERHEHAMQVRELDELDKRDNEGFWNYDKTHDDAKYVDNGYFEREYPSDYRPSEPTNMSNTFKQHQPSKFWTKSHNSGENSDGFSDEVVFDPHYDDRYGKSNPNTMSETEIDSLNIKRAAKESMGITSDDEDEELQRALKESRDMYLDTNVEKDNIFAENVGHEAENMGDWNSDPEDFAENNYFHNCYLNEDFQLQPDDDVPIAIENDNSWNGSGYGSDMNESINIDELAALL